MSSTILYFLTSNDKVVELKLVDQNIEYLQSCIVDYEEMIEAGKKARIVFQEVAQLTQKKS